MTDSIKTFGWNKIVIGIACLVIVTWSLLAYKNNPIATKHTASLSVDETPLLVEPKAGIDKTLVFMRYIDFLSSDWPSVTTNQEAFAKAVADYRKQLALSQEYVQSAGLDNELNGILVAQEELLAVYIEVLRSMNNIDEAAIARATREISESSFNAGYAGGSAAAIAADNDAGFAGSVLVGLGTYALGMWLQESENSAARNQAYNELVRQEIQKYESAFAKYEELLRKTSQRLTARYNWGSIEGGYAMPQTHLDQKQAAVINGDWAALASLLNSECAARPRDPFILAQSAWADEQIYSSNEGQTYEQSEMKLLAAIALIPGDEFYDSIRSMYYAGAGRLALLRTGLTVKGKGFVNGPFDSSRAIRLFLAARKYDPYDSDGWLRLQLGRAYAYAGYFNKSLSYYNEIESLYSRDSGFLYNLACIYSAEQQYPKAWAALQKCINECGFADIMWAQNDPDLAEIRKRYPADFQKLTAIRTRGDIEWGLMWDDPILRNDSPFPLINVRFTPSILSKGQVYTKELKTDYLAPGDQCKWPDVFSIPGSTFDSYNYTVVSDQGSASTH